MKLVILVRNKRSLVCAFVFRGDDDEQSLCLASPRRFLLPLPSALPVGGMRPLHAPRNPRRRRGNLDTINHNRCVLPPPRRRLRAPFKLYSLRSEAKGTPASTARVYAGQTRKIFTMLKERGRFSGYERLWTEMLIPYDTGEKLRTSEGETEFR